MTGQFDGIVRDRDPETSWDAAARQTDERVNHLQAAISVILGTRGPLTDEQLVDEYDAYRASRPRVLAVTPQSIRTRRHELHVAGKVRPTGQRRATRSGSSGTVWELVPIGDEHEATA